MASSQALPEPMNSSPHHSKVKVTITLADPTFVAGTHVSGKLEMECRADKGLGIGIMMIELFAVQELSSRDHSATSTFLHSRRLFQGPGLPPSNAVQAHPSPGAPPLPPTYHQARRGRSTFLFRIPLPASSPPSITFGTGLARVRYELRASVGVYWKQERRLVVDKREVDVVEQWVADDMVLGRVPEAVVVGENGKVWMQGRVVGGVVVAGGSACLELQVKNHSSKKNTGLTLTLTRTLYLPSSGAPGSRAPVQISDTLTTVPFRGPEYIIPPGAEGVANLVFDIPWHARGVRGGVLDGEEAVDVDAVGVAGEGEGDEGAGGRGKGPRHTDSLFEIRCKVEVKLTMGMGSKDLLLEIPIDIVHPRALPAQLPTPYSAQPASAPAPQPHAYPYAYTPPPASPAPYAEYANEYTPYYPLHPVPYVDPAQNQVWMPPPLQALVPIPTSPLGYPYASHSPVPQEGYGLVQAYTTPPPAPAAAAPHLYAGYPPDAPLLPPPPQHTLLPSAPASAESNVDEFGLARAVYIPRPVSVGPVAAASQAAPPLIAGLPPPPAGRTLLPLHALQQHANASLNARLQSSQTQQHLHLHPHTYAQAAAAGVAHKDEGAMPYEPEVGKGDRALRVSRRLRLSSRTRSVSPLSHRYPLPAVSIPVFHAGQDADVCAARDQPRGLPPPPLLLPAQNATDTGDRDTNGEAPVHVHSPRPQLTPKHSFTRDPVDGATTARSERVASLEKMADEVARRSRDLSCDLPRGAVGVGAGRQEGKEEGPKEGEAKDEANVNKTLPGPPVPSGKHLLSPLPSRARADIYFAAQGQGAGPIAEMAPLPSDQTPPTPALLAVLPSRGRHPRAPEKNKEKEKDALQTESGLDALERRLLAEVGTRRLGARDQRPGVRDVLKPTNAGADTDANANANVSADTNAGENANTNANSDAADLELESSASPVMAMAMAIPAKSPETLHDSAISSLTLAGGLGGDESDGELEVEFDGRTHRAGGGGGDGDGSSDGGRGGASPGAGLHLHMRERERDRERERAQISTLTRTLHLERVRSRQMELENLDELESMNVNVNGGWGVASGSGNGNGNGTGTGRSKESRTSGKKKERTGTKSLAAKGRVAAWLGGIDPDVPPQEQIIPPSPSVARKSPSPFQMGDEELEQTPVAVVGLPHDEPPQQQQQQQQQPQASASPNPRSSGFVPISTLKKDPLQHRPLIAADATVVVEARRVQDIWSSHAQDTPMLSARQMQMPQFFSAPLKQQGESVSMKTDRKVSPPSAKAPPPPLPDSRAKPLSYSAAARNVWRLPEVVKSPVALPPPPIPPKPPVLPEPKMVQQVGRVQSVFPQPKPEVKYDIRSARGGRGGKVTSVANLWSSGAINRGEGKGLAKPADSKPLPPASGPPPSSSLRTEKKLFSDAVMTPAPSPKRSPAAPAKAANAIKPSDAQKRPDSRTAFPEPRLVSQPTPKKVPSSTALKPPVLGGAGKGSSKPSDALVQNRPATAMANSPYSLGKTTPTSHSTPNSSDPKLHNLVAKGGVKPVFKASSDPAVVVSSHAVPTLSSTASLARPQSSAAQKHPSRPVQLPPVLATSVAPALSAAALPSSGTPRPASPSKPIDLAFGQARIRDLIKKYQGGQGQKT